MNYIHNLHSRFVIVPIDKATINFSIICKAFYIQVLKDEVGLSSEGLVVGNAVYQPGLHDNNDIFGKNNKKHQQLNTCLYEENRNMPILY